MDTNRTGSLYANGIYGSSMLSLLTNSTLLFLYLRCPLRNIKTYKHFFAATALHDIIVSAVMILCVPRAFHGSHYYVIASTGLIQQWQAGAALIILACIAYFSSFLLLTDSFVYRYVHVCWPELSCRYTTKTWILLICIVNVFLLSNYAFLVLKTFVPNEAFRAQIYTEMSVNAFVGLPLRRSPSFNLFEFLTADVITVLLCSCAMFFCAIRIHLTLKHNGVSSNVKRLHRQMFRVLLFQTTCSTMFVSIPSFVVSVVLFGGINTSQLVLDCAWILYSLYPVFNSVVTTLSIADYRRYLRSLFSNS